MTDISDTETYLKKCISIDPLRLTGEFTEIAAELSYWNEEYADALRAQLVTKIQRERMWAQAYLEKREVMQKPTENTLAALIEVDPRYIVARDDEAEAAAECARLRGVSEAVKTKRDMLVSLGAQIRAEMSGDPSIRRQHSDAHMQEDPLAV